MAATLSSTPAAGKENLEVEVSCSDTKEAGRVPAETTKPALAAAAAGRGASETGHRRPSASQTPQKQGQRRWGTVVLLSAISLAILAGDLATFGRGTNAGWVDEFLKYGNSGGYAAEIVLCVSLAVIALTRYGPSWMRADPSQVVSASRPAPLKKGARAGPPLSKAAQFEAERASGSLAEQRRKSVTSRWNQAIDQAARQGDADKAGQLLLEIEKSGGQPEAVTYNFVIRACAKKGDESAAEWWLKHMEARGVQPTICTYNTLLDACAKADNAEACEAWLERVIASGMEANVISYATAIYARARRGDVPAAEAWLRRMKAAGITPDAVSYNSLIHACGVKGDTAGAERWWEEMRAQRLEMSVATFTAVVDACAKSGDVPRAEKWLLRMEEEGIGANVVTYSAMIDACAKAGNLPRAEYWHDMMTHKGIAPNAHSYSAVINACAKSGGPNGAEAAEMWLDRSEKAGVVNDVVVYSSVIDACGKAGDAERAMRVFRRMQANGLRPHIVAYAALARPYAYRGDWIKVETIAQSMLADGVKVNEYFLYAQLLAYAVARPRQPSRAEACFRASLKNGVGVNDHVVSALARAVGRYQAQSLMDELCGGREVPNPQARGRDYNAGTGARGVGLRRPSAVAGPQPAAEPQDI